MEINKVIQKTDDINYLQDEDWLNKDKHIFVLSSSGKPIFSRYGDENKLVTLFGVIQALVSFVNLQETNDEIQNVIVGSHRFVFLQKSHFIFMLVIRDNFSKWTESNERLKLQLNFIHDNIISTFSLTQLNKIFVNQCNFDLRQSIRNHNNYFNRWISWTNSLSFTFNTVQCKPMLQSVRHSITDVLNQCCSKQKNLVFAIILLGQQLVTISQLKKYLLPITDFHLILNLIDTLNLDEDIESWSPICLSKFNSTGFMHCYTASLLKSYDLKIVLLTSEKDSFYKCKEIRENFFSKFDSSLVELVPNVWLKPVGTEDFEKLSKNEFQVIYYIFYKIDKSDYGFLEWIKCESLREKLQKIAEHFFDLINEDLSKNCPKLIYDCDMEFKCFAQKNKGYKLIIITDSIVDHATFQDLLPKIIKILKKNQDYYFFQNDMNTFN